jgi:hypothetical protein
VGAAATTAPDRTTDDGHDDDHGTANHDDHRTTPHDDDRTADLDDVPDSAAGATGTADDTDDCGRL